MGYQVQVDRPAGMVGDGHTVAATPTLVIDRKYVTSPRQMADALIANARNAIQETA